jgi:hypothetical protein
VLLLQPSTESLVVAAGRSERRVRAGAALPPGDGPHEVLMDFHLAATLIEGRVTDTRGTPVATDIGLFLGQPPYALSHGRDSRRVPTGVPHRVPSDALGWFHMALRPEDVPGTFRIEAVGDTLDQVYATVRTGLAASVGTVHRLPLVVGIWQGGRECTSVPALGTRDDIDYARDIQPLWNEYCTGCHNPTATNSGSLDLTAAAGPAHTVNGPSSFAPGIMRVHPGDPDRSFLFEKINCADPQAGSRMRPTGAIPVEAQRLVRDWIDSLTQVFASGFEDGTPP